MSQAVRQIRKAKHILSLSVGLYRELAVSASQLVRR